MTRTTANRRGLTLYEVVLSLAILLGSLAVLAQLIATGSRAATQSRMRTEAMLLCQTKLAEVVAGNVPLTPVDQEVLEETATGRWVWSLGIFGGQGATSLAGGAQGFASPHPDLLLLEVTVSRIAADQTIEATQTLTRLMRNPQLYAEAAEQAAELAAEAEAE